MTEIRSTDYFAIVPEWVLTADISSNAVRLYAVLNRFANSSGRAWPSRRTLAEIMRLSVATVDRAKDELIAIGALTVEHRTGPAGDPSSNLYTLLTRQHDSTAPSSPMTKGSPTREGTGTPTRDALNRASMNESQIGKPSPMKQRKEPTYSRPQCSRCLGKNRDIEGFEGSSCVPTQHHADGKVTYSYVICPVCEGNGEL